MEQSRSSSTNVFVAGWWPWILVAVVALIVRAPFLFYFGMSSDAYNNSQQLPQYTFLASEGRPGAYLLLRLLDGLGVFGPVAQYANILLGVPLLCAAVMLLWKSALVWNTRVCVAIAVGAVLFVAHPYQTEILTFRDAVPFFAISTWLGCAGYFYATLGGRRRFTLGVVMIVMGLAVYQTFLNFLVIAWLMTIVLAYTAPARLHADLRPDLHKVVRMGLLAIVTSCVVYVITNRLIDLLTAVHRGDRVRLLAPAQIADRISDFWTVIQSLLVGDMIVNAPIASVATTALLAIAVAIYLLLGRSAVRFLLVPAAFALALVASVGIAGVGSGFWPVPRVLVGYALLPAFGAISLLLLARGVQLRQWVVAGCAVLTFSYTAIGATVAADQVRINARDVTLATLIAARVSLTPHMHLAIIGGPRVSYAIKAHRGDMNQSAYWKQWSQVRVISDALGYPIDAATAEERARALAYCMQAEPWPAQDSTSMLGGNLAVVCFSHS